MSPSVSVIIPVYHSQDTLAHCLDSFLAQTFSGEMEILCIGDNVEDPSHAIAEAYTRAYPGKVKWRLQAGRGQGGARNAGLDTAAGEYILFADADDQADPALVQVCLTALLESRADFVCCGFDRASPGGHVYSIERPAHRKTVVAFASDHVVRLAFVYPAPWGKLFHRDVIAESRFPDNPISAYEDLIFFLSLAPKIRTCVLLPDVLHHYRVGENSSVTKANLEKTRVFRDDLLALQHSFAVLGLSSDYHRLLDLAAFIHVVIADAHRMAENPAVSLQVFLQEAKVFLDQHFSGWRHIGLRPYGRFTVRCAAVYFLKFLFMTGGLMLFLRTYNFMIKRLKRDVKW